MSYNWVDASTPQGRERLKELVHKGPIIAYFGHANKYMDVSFEGGNYFIAHEDAYDSIEELIGDDDYFRFLDPSPSPEPVADENGLLPCPFCGGKAIVAEHDLLYTRFIANCESCEAESSVFLKRVEAIAAWNRRAGKETNP
jgi:Lar family restriction alleviation protein